MPVTDRHREYSAGALMWQRCRTAFRGSDAVKAQRSTYLPPLEGMAETTTEYTNYLTRALYYPATERTVAGLTGLIFRRAPDWTVPEALQSQLGDLTLTGVDADTFALQTVQELLVTGRVGLLVDWAGEDVSGRPYWVRYVAEDLVNWRTEKNAAGELVPVLVVLRETYEVPGRDEFSPTLREQYRVLRLTEGVWTVDVYRQVATTGAPEAQWVSVEQRTPMRRGQPLGAIPFVCLTSDGLTWAVTKPPLLDLVDVNLSHYRTSADLEHGRHFTALPTPYITSQALPDSKLRIGAGEAWVIPDSAAKVGMLEFTGTGLGALVTALEQKQQMMAVLGARLLEQEPRAAETAEAVRLRQTGSASALQVLAEQGSAGLTAALRQHAAWLQVDPEAVACTLNTDFFDLRLPANEVQALVSAWQAGAISWATLYWNLQHGEVARPGVPPETERAAIDTEEGGAPPPVGGPTVGAEAGEVEEPGEAEGEEPPEPVM